MNNIKYNIYNQTKKYSLVIGSEYLTNLTIEHYAMAPIPDISVNQIPPVVFFSVSCRKNEGFLGRVRDPLLVFLGR